MNEVILHGHDVIVEHDAGAGSGASDAEYAAVGATIVGSAEAVFERGGDDRQGQGAAGGRARNAWRGADSVHLPPPRPDPEQTEDLVKSNAVCIAYETVTSPSGGLPLLAPMSEVAGRLSIQAAAHALEKVNGGKGMLLGGVPGVLPAKVVVIGGGVVGTHAAHIAMGMGADTWVIDRSAEALKALWRQFGRPLDTVYSTRTAIERHVTDADVVIGGVLIPGAAAPKLVTAEMVRRMKPGSVIVDVAIDQGGCCETSHPTTHSNPTYIVDDVVHYCVANMPGAVPRTSTFALNNATLPHVLTLANKGYRQALIDDPHLRNGLNVHAGEVTCREVALALGYPYRSPMDAIAA